MVKYIIIVCLVLLSIVGQAESIHFRVISKIKQVDLKDVGGKIDGNGQQISIDGDLLKFSTGSKEFNISEQLYEEDSSGDTYYSFVYFDKRRKFYTTVLFSDKETIIVITDSDGVGYLYYVEIL